MKENRSKLLVLGIALIMVVSVFALFLPGVNNASQNNTKITSYVQSSFEKSLSTGTPVQMNSENLSAVQNQLSKYSATPMSSDQIISFMVSFKITHNSQLTSYITQEICNMFHELFWKLCLWIMSCTFNHYMFGTCLLRF